MTKEYQHMEASAWWKCISADVYFRWEQPGCGSGSVPRVDEVVLSSSDVTVISVSRMAAPSLPFPKAEKEENVQDKGLC